MSWICIPFTGHAPLVRAEQSKCLRKIIVPCGRNRSSVFGETDCRDNLTAQILGPGVGTSLLQWAPVRMARHRDQATLEHDQRDRATRGYHVRSTQRRAPKGGRALPKYGPVAALG